MAVTNEVVERTVLDANGLPSRVLTLGGSLESSPAQLILVIPGNPGAAGYYKDFMAHLHKEIKAECPVWTVSHLGHDDFVLQHDGEDITLPVPRVAKDLYSNLGNQINHKINFIQSHIPKTCDLTLVGHSIGCKMSLEVMRHFQREDPERKIKGFFLFPTIERMRETPSGRGVWIVANYFIRLVVCLAYLIRILVPESVVKSLIRWHLRRRGQDVSDSIIETTLGILNPFVVENAISLARHELLTVRELNYEALREVLPKIRFYFGTIDGWCPLDYYKEMKAKLGDELQAEVCQRKIEHAFVLHSSEEMSEIVGKWLCEE